MPSVVFCFFSEIASLIHWLNSSSSLETQGQLVGSGKMAAKCSRMGEGAPGILVTLNKILLVFDWVQKIFLCPIRGQNLLHSICDLLIQRSLPANSTVPSLPVKNCLPYQSGSYRRAFLENESWNWFVKSSIPGALSPVHVNFRPHYSWSNWLPLGLQGWFFLRNIPKIIC